AIPKPERVFLETLEEAVYTLTEAFKVGGREFLISENVYKKLNQFFSFREKRLGGNGFNMGKALHELGLTPLISYPIRPPSIMLNSPDVKIACKDGFKTPKQAIRYGDPEYDHLIFEFIQDTLKGVNTSGRHIFSWDLMSFHGFFDEEFFSYSFNRKYTEVLIFAYAHLLLPAYKKKTNEIADWLEEANRPKVHFELGQGSEDSVKYALKVFTDKQCVDSIGLNEKECVQYFNAKDESFKELFYAGVEAIKNLGVRRICVHTSSFAFSVSKFSLEREIEALSKASLTAAALTMGSIRDNINKVRNLSSSNVKVEKGKVEKSYNYCVIPVYINPQPRILTGLGDAFSAVQAVVSLA
ncbi:MAG: ADP-dependent glucokinase/phosphofructokinase, partial [Candidatus Bathyarchaeota archaeon]|nr:ADP-dependent glucokinase/phosphofructokinase [Candidatus Bathyarchaeota archaeon]